MSYTYEDILRLKLPIELQVKFYKLFIPNFRWDEAGYIADMYPTITVMLGYQISQGYRGKFNYIMSDDVREKAIIAFEGCNDEEIKKDILNKWLLVVAEFSKLDRILLGWDKYE